MSMAIPNLQRLQNLIAGQTGKSAGLRAFLPAGISHAAA
jgi:hypothetical protein